MPSRRERYLDHLSEAFIEATEKKERSEVTVKGYRWMIGKVQRELLEAEMDGEPVFSLPKQWDEETVRYIIDVIYEDNLPSVVRRNVSVLSTYAMFHGNSIIKDLELEWPEDEWIHVDWLQPSDAIRVIEACEGLERIIVHLEMGTGMRRMEVLRLKVKNIGSGYLDVLGKGLRDGKRRTVAFHKDTLAELEFALKLRDIQIQKAIAIDPETPIPESLLIYCGQDGKLHSYKRTAIDNRLEKVNKKTTKVHKSHPPKDIW